MARLAGGVNGSAQLTVPEDFFGLYPSMNGIGSATPDCTEYDSRLCRRPCKLFGSSGSGWVLNLFRVFWCCFVVSFLNQKKGSHENTRINTNKSVPRFPAFEDGSVLLRLTQHRSPNIAKRPKLMVGHPLRKKSNATTKNTALGAAW